MSWFTELVLKCFWCCFGFDIMHKDKVIESVFTMYDPDGMFCRLLIFLRFVLLVLPQAILP